MVRECRDLLTCLDTWRWISWSQNVEVDSLLLAMMLGVILETINTTNITVVLTLKRPLPWQIGWYYD